MMDTLQKAHTMNSNLDYDGNTLNAFLIDWDNAYKAQVSHINLFNPQSTSLYTKDHIEAFVRAFYHVRGHFHKFLWYLGNTAISSMLKEKIIHNLREEFGGENKSHEQLYFDFSDHLGIDVSNEFITEKSNFPFIQKFNRGHLEWLKNHTWDENWCLFSAYERLDNIDYGNLLKLAISFGVSGSALNFFKIHFKADHFDHTYTELKHIWRSDPEIVKIAFDFISSHQITMWSSLNKAIEGT